MTKLADLIAHRFVGRALLVVASVVGAGSIAFHLIH